jgi:CubicO group peptidase (beta-lactamase class C family)/beta-glucosidase-like glycosyl hydrolase
MKKVWQVIFVLMTWAISAKAEYIDALPADKWVDSLYQKLTIAERVGQLLDLRVAPNADNIEALQVLISTYHIGAITLTGGDAAATIKLINRLKELENVPVFISSDNNQSLSFSFFQPMPMPSPETFNKASDPELLNEAFDVLADIYADFGVRSNTYNPFQASFSEAGFEIYDQSGNEVNLFTNLPDLYAKHGMVISTDLHFSFLDDFAFSPKEMDNWNASEWKEKVIKGLAEWPKLNKPLSIINIKSLPDFPENEAEDFFKKVINPLFWKQLQYAGLLSVDYNSITQSPLQKDNSATVRKLLKIGADKIVTSTDIDVLHSALMKAIEDRDIRKNEIRDKVKRNLRLKYESGLSVDDHPLIYADHVTRKLHSPELRKISFMVYSKASEMVVASKNELPILDVTNSSFASLSLGYSESKTFQETLDKYAPFVHYIMPDAAFNPYDLNVIAPQLKQFDHIIIGLHTNDLLSFDQNTLDFLNELKAHSNIVMVFLGGEINGEELDGFPAKVFMQEDNDFTQRIAACKIFGADNASIGRLAYSVPELQGMDSRTLERIDAIAKEAISIGATPGCQILVAKNGSVVMEKGYGFYTYDSIMEVDTRTIYDLASITKVAATTQALMKLIEDRQIHLDSALGKYLPELAGTNKEQLKVRDVLSHQSGLRAFYPFWRYTIDDKEQTLQYYKRYPDQNYSNTVAYGMFAGEDLKDSLWNWTIDTKLRRKRDDYQPYDYKYSDLGFYLLQMLVERASGITLDAYMDSVFYKPMGMSTMSYNPLCKFQLKRITPTERDMDFRHVLVWGTVHDQIAAMKGGVSGHAGLFSNAHDVAKMMQLQLQGGVYGGKQFLSKEIVDEFNEYQSDESRRGLGWDKPEKRDEYNPASRYASQRSFGHMGFTGTIVWADPAFDLIYVFLSNRIYPDAGNTKLADFDIRKRIQDVVYESIWNYEKQYN